jgi:hypothetical protein
MTLARAAMARSPRNVLLRKRVAAAKRGALPPVVTATLRDRATLGEAYVAAALASDDRSFR